MGRSIEVLRRSVISCVGLALISTQCAAEDINTARGEVFLPAESSAGPAARNTLIPAWLQRKMSTIPSSHYAKVSEGHHGNTALSAADPARQNSTSDLKSQFGAWFFF